MIEYREVFDKAACVALRWVAGWVVQDTSHENTAFGS